MADFRLGRLKFKWRGEWSAATAYVIDDIVKFGANSYVCVVNHTSAASETSFYSSDVNNYWEIHTEGLRHRGNWQGGNDPIQGTSLDTWYAINDIVKYGNTQYRCTTGHTSSANFASSNWTIYAEGLTFEDTWALGTPYQLGDIVTYGGYTYIARQDNNSVQPNTNNTIWEVVSTGYQAQGYFNPATTYAPGNVVQWGGNTYSAKQTVSGRNLGIATTTGDGSIQTYTFSFAQSSNPFGLGDEVVITACIVGGYNGTYRIVSSSTTGFTVAGATTGASTGGNTAYIPVPTNPAYWDLVVEGFNWGGQWSSTTVYQLGDVVNRNGNSYICITSNTLGAATAPELDS